MLRQPRTSFERMITIHRSRVTNTGILVSFEMIDAGQPMWEAALAGIAARWRFRWAWCS